MDHPPGGQLYNGEWEPVGIGSLPKKETIAREQSKE